MGARFSAPTGIKRSHNKLVGITLRGLDFLFGDGIAQKVSLLVLQAGQNSPVLMENVFGVNVSASPDHCREALRIMVRRKERIERARRLCLRNNSIETLVPVILDAHRVFI